MLFLSSVFSKKDVPKKKKKILAESLGYLILSKKGFMVILQTKELNQTNYQTRNANIIGNI